MIFFLHSELERIFYYISLGASTDPDFIADNKLALRSILQQKCALACFREGSEEIVGVNMTYVCSKDDQFFKEAYERVRFLKILFIFCQFQFFVNIFCSVKVRKPRNCITFSLHFTVISMS